jgi:hypothetical protein
MYIANSDATTASTEPDRAASGPDVYAVIGHRGVADNAVFMIGQAVITMYLGVLQQRSAELRRRLYDLVREVVRNHVGLPRPAAAPNNSGSLRLMPQHYPATPPVAPSPCNFRSHSSSLPGLPRHPRCAKLGAVRTCGWDGCMTGTSSER